MASEVSIINQGLYRVGANPIVARDGSGDNEVIANAIYDHHRDYLLRRHTWNFATKRIQLARSANTPPFGYDYQYPLPSDYMRTITISDNTNGTGTLIYKIENDVSDTRVIVTSAIEVYMKYVAKITDPAQMDPDFQECLSLKLASVFALKIAQSLSLHKEIKVELNSALRAARAVDGQEDLADQMPEGSWSMIRNGGLAGDIDATS